MSAMTAVVAVCAYMVEYPFVRESYIPLLLLALMCHPQSKYWECTIQVTASQDCLLIKKSLLFKCLEVFARHK